MCENYMDNIDKLFDDMTDEEFEKIIKDAEIGYTKSWLPENQNSFYTCIYCGKDVGLLVALRFINQEIMYEENNIIQ